MESKETTLNFSELIESDNLNTIRLSIYYMDLFMLTHAPVKLDDLINQWHDYKVIVTGEQLAEHRELLERLINAELLPVKNESYVNARLYYVFEHEEHGEIFSFLAFGGGNTEFVNNMEVEFNSVFYEFVLPFLPDDAVKTIVTYLDNMRKDG
jgi:hypothetical protein